MAGFRFSPRLNLLRLSVYICFLFFISASYADGGRLIAQPHDLSIMVGTEAEVSLTLLPYNETVLIFPLYEPRSAIDKITPLGNVTIQGDEANGVTFNLSIHAMMGGHVTVYWNTSDPDIKTENAYVRVTIIHYEEVFVICVVVGWLYFAAWSISFYPQVHENFVRKCVVGLNLDFVVLNVLGNIVYGLFNFGLLWIPSVQLQYYQIHPMGIIPVQINDAVFSLHAIVLSTITAIQCAIYERGSQKVTMYALTMITLSTAVVVFSSIAAGAGALTWLSVLYYCSYIKLAVTLIKYIPQAHMNYVRKSTVGFSIGSILLDMMGAHLSIFQMFLLAYNNDDWSSLFGDPTKFGLGLFTISFDLLFVVQHYVLYRTAGPAHTMLVNGE